jgi:hypothetical protein
MSKENVRARLSQTLSLRVVAGKASARRSENNAGVEYVEIGEVEPVRVMGAEGYPYGFNVTTEDGKPLVSFAYAYRALAEAAATHLESALLNAISVHPYAE